MVNLEGQLRAKWLEGQFVLTILAVDSHTCYYTLFVPVDCLNSFAPSKCARLTV